MGSFISLYIVYLLIRTANKYLDKDSYKHIDNPYTEEKKIENYYPLVFHIIIALLVVFSIFSSGFIDNDRIHALVADGFFQFMSTALILLISLINPFVSFSPETRTKLETWEVKGKGFVNFLLSGYNWRIIKALLCIFLVFYFIYNGYLVLPAFNQGLISDVALVLIFLFVFGNLVQLLRNPKVFKQTTLFRLSMLYKSIKQSLIISIILIIIVNLYYIITKVETQILLNFEGIALLVYNIIMARNEYKVLKAESVPD